MSKGKVLVTGSNATRIEVQGSGWGPTGNYLNETVVPIMALISAGYGDQLATPNGTKPHMDKASDSAVHFGSDTSAYARAKDFWTDDSTMNQVSTLRSVIEEAGSAAVNDPSATNVAQIVIGGTRRLTPDDALSMPSFGHAYSDDEIAELRHRPPWSQGLITHGAGRCRPASTGIELGVLHRLANLAFHRNWFGTQVAWS